MNLKVPDGRYVVAVSGGVDSMALLHALMNMDIASNNGVSPKLNPKRRFIVAHYDHGIRVDSKDDRRLVEHVARSYGLNFVYNEGRLGAGTSEADARKARYAFLYSVRQHTNARGIMTAHHQDDVLETALLNLERGTNRRGLGSISSTPEMLRPLLNVSKKQIVAYARNHSLLWHEDSTNYNTRYLRNYIRMIIMPKMTPLQRQALARLINRVQQLNSDIDAEVLKLLAHQPAPDRLYRKQVSLLPSEIATELVAGMLRQAGILDFDAATLHRLVGGIGRLHTGNRINIKGHWWLVLEKEQAVLRHEPPMKR